MLRSTFFYRTNFEMLACGHLLLPLLWISSYKPWQRMTHQIHDAAPDMKCRRSVLVPKCAAQSQQKVILTAQKSYLTKCHCIALQVCIFAIVLTPFSISYLRNLIVKLAPLKLCDIAAAKSKATWVEITPERYCFFGSIEIDRYLVFFLLDTDQNKSIFLASVTTFP